MSGSASPDLSDAEQSFIEIILDEYTAIYDEIEAWYGVCPGAVVAGLTVSGDVVIGTACAASI